MVIKHAKLDTFIQVIYNGIEALEFLTYTEKYKDNRKYPQPGIIFLDINMPKMNGREFLEKYKELPKEQKGKIVMAILTSSMNQDDVDQSKKDINMIGFINKPLNKRKLMKIIDENFDILTPDSIK